uniref:Uncharacterized protein n=1 Tax=Lepeophtheirus salmonis TaxID=72036 RepID=A0A0K2U8B5_LEPSM
MTDIRIELDFSFPVLFI